MKVYLTDNFLQTGKITEKTAHPQTGHPTVIRLTGSTPNKSVKKPHWHETKEEAIADARTKIEKEIISIAKSLDEINRRIEKVTLLKQEFGEAK